MPIISNEQKNKNLEQINATYGRKKFFIIITLFFFIAYIVLLALSIFMGGSPKWHVLSFVDRDMPGYISIFGYVMVSIAGLLFICTIISIVFLSKFKNPKSIIKAKQDNLTTEAARKGRISAFRTQNRKSKI